MTDPKPCPSCREPMEHPSGDGCANMTAHKERTMSDEKCCGACGYPIYATKESACDWCRQAADRIEALTEQLAAARQDAKEAEAYAEELEEDRDALDAKVAKAVKALTPLAAIADAFDANELDDEARKFWGQHSVNTTPHEDIELYQGRGGKQLLTLADCTFARATLAEIKGESHE